jgi:shikimate dehydrogenase
MPRSTTTTADGLINTTPIGMEVHHCLPTDPARITPRYWIAEIVYFPIETALLAVPEPKAVLPCPVGNGGVSSGSGVSPFTGQAPDTARMQAHFTTLTG